MRTCARERCSQHVSAVVGSYYWVVHRRRLLAEMCSGTQFTREHIRMYTVPVGKYTEFSWPPLLYLAHKQLAAHLRGPGSASRIVY